jgi:hypothetical protein
LAEESEGVKKLGTLTSVLILTSLQFDIEEIMFM